MSLAAFQFTITDEDGNVQEGATVTVRNEANGNLASLYSDRAGTTPIANPINVDGLGFSTPGFVRFFVVGGSYRIQSDVGSLAAEPWRYVGIGLGGETDTPAGVVTGIRQTFDTATGAADPGAGKWRANNATFASITALYLDNLQNSAADITAWLDAMDDVGSAQSRGLLRFENINAPDQFAEFYVTGSVTDSTGYRTLAVMPRAQAGWPFSNGAITAENFIPVGLTGSDAGVPYIWDTGTSDADPGAGKLRANNASIASATFLYVSKTSDAGSAMATFLATLDDSSSTIKGILILRRLSDGKQAIVGVTSLTDATNYVKVGIANSSGETSFSASEALGFQFFRSGDATTNGPSSFTNAAVLFAAPMLNGTITVQLGSPPAGDLPIALKTLAGTDPSPIDPIKTAFRNSSLSIGNYTVSSIETALSLDIPYGAAIGFSNATAGRLWLLEILNGSTVELAVINCLNGKNIYPLKATGIISTTAFDTNSPSGSDSPHVAYSTNARSNVPYRVLGCLTWESGLTTAGVWDAPPTRIELAGMGMPLPNEVIQTVHSETTTSGTTSSTSALAALSSSPSLVITPTSCANLVRVQADGPMLNNGNATNVLQMARGSTLIGQPQAFSVNVGTVPFSFDVVDAPLSTSAQTYQFQGRVSTGTLNFPAGSLASTATGVTMTGEELMA